jgi:gamma-glutamyltranspeptidase/glutathione hydrolase
MDRTVVSTTSGNYAADAAKEILQKGGSAADAVAAASMIQVVDAAGTYVSFAGMLVALYYEASSGKFFSIDADYGIPAGKQGNNLSFLYQDGHLGAGVLVPGYFAGIRDLLGRFGKIPFEEVISYSIDRCNLHFVPHERLLKRVKKRSKTNPPSVETFEIENGEIVQAELAKTLEQVRTLGIQYMYTGGWAQKFVQTVQGAGGIIELKDLHDYQASIQEAISTGYKDYTVYTIPPANAGGLINFLILGMLERVGLKDLGHYTKNPDAFIQMITGMRAYMPFLNMILGNIDDTAFSRALGGRSIKLDECLDSKIIDLLWDAIHRGDLDTVPIVKPNNTDAVAAMDDKGNIAVLVHSACATTGRDGLVVDGISLPRMAAEFPVGAERCGNRVPGIFSPVMAISQDKIFAMAAIHASLYEKQSAVLMNVLEYGMSLKAANALPTPLYPDYDEQGNATEILFLEKFEQDFIQGLKDRGLRFKDVREGGLARFVGEENLDALESPLIGLELDRAYGTCEGVTSRHYDGKVA